MKHNDRLTEVWGGLRRRMLRNIRQFQQWVRNQFCS